MARGSGSIAAALIGVTLAWGLPGAAYAAGTSPPQPPKPSEPPQRAIVIAINGQDLARDPAPRMVGGRLLVPVVRIYSALGIAVTREGDDIAAQIPGGTTITLHIGSSTAQIGDRPVTLQSPAVEIDGATYVPLRFVADSLGAQVSYDSKAARVDVISAVVGRTPELTSDAGNGTTQVVGTVAAVDLNSAPESVTVVRGDAERTIAITSGAKITIQDVVTKTNSDGTLRDILPGDAVSVFIEKNGHVEQIVDRFASRGGIVAAVSPGAVVLQSGYVVSPDRTTAILLNGQPVAIGDLKVGDSLTVRSNPDTAEKRQIIASRAVAATPQAAGATTISNLTVSAKGALRAGDSFEVTLSGTPGGKATFDIGTYLEGVPMTETSPGTYTAKYQIPSGVNFGSTPIYGHLVVSGSAAPRAQAPSLVAVSTTPPQITDVAPPAGQAVNNNRPNLFATYTSPTNVDINPSSVTIHVNGLDVTASAVRTSTFITYTPAVALADGTVTVRVSVADFAGNRSERSWSFTIHTH
jgi:hypothetical protein